MNKMKKLLLSLTLACAALLMAQCRKPDASNWPNSGYEAQTITFSNADNSGEKGNLQENAYGLLGYHWVNTTTYKDVIHVYASKNAWDSENNTADFSTQSEYCGVLNNIKITSPTTANFTGRIEIPDGTQALRFVHYGQNVVVSDNGEASVDFSTQAGTLADISKYVVAVCDQQYQGETAYENCKLKVQFAIAKLKFMLFDAVNITVSGMDATGLSVAATGNITYNANTSSTLTAPGTGDFYTVFMPKSSANYVFSNTSSDRAEAENWTFVANGYYTKPNGVGKALTIVNQKKAVNFKLPSPYQDLWWMINNLGATCGSTDVSWYGNHYAWGETNPYNQVPSPYTGWTGTTNTTYQALINNNTPKTLYKPDNYKWGTSETNFFKYTKIDEKVELELDDDAAHVTLGEPWRIPTQNEWKALYDNCTFEWLVKGNYSVNVTTFKAPTGGCLVVRGGKNGVTLDVTKYMFLPAGGSCNAEEPYHNATTNCYYLTSSRLIATSTDDRDAYYVRLKNSGSFDVGNAWGYRDHGMSVRPVFTAE